MADDERLRIPVNLLDLFYVRRSASAPTQFVAVVGCLGGECDVVTGEALDGLPPSLIAQIEALQVGRRHQFRAILAEELRVCVLDSIQQRARTAGFNDPLRLHCLAPTRLSTHQGRLLVQWEQSGEPLAVGRLDVLAALEECIQHALEHPTAAGATVYHLMLPIGRADAIREGRDIALMYPAGEGSAPEAPDNTPFLLAVMYEILLGLQEDMRQAGSTHPFTALALPVPSRGLLEERLTSEGYRIDGDEAFKIAGRSAEDARTETPLFDWMREFTSQLLGPRLRLPRQATLADYRAVIQEVLPAIATPADTAMRAALAGRVQPQVAPVDEPRVSRAGPSLPASPPGRPAALPGGAAPGNRPTAGMPTRRHAVPAVDHRTLAHDFQGPLAGRPPTVQHAEWAADFAGAAGTSETTRRPSPDYAADFADPARPAGAGGGGAPQAPGRKPGTEGEERRPVKEHGANDPGSP